MRTPSKLSQTFLDSLQDVYNTGDIIIIDRNVFAYAADMEFKNMKYITIDSSEKTKSFEKT